MASETLKLVAEITNLDQAMEFVEECADRCGLDPKKKFGLTVALEEAFVNVCNYAYPDNEGDIEISCGCEHDSMIVEIADSGVAFDVLSLEDPDTTAGIDDREIGGLGVFFIRKFTEEATYRREQERNILKLLIRNDT